MQRWWNGLSSAVVARSSGMFSPAQGSRAQPTCKQLCLAGTPAPCVCSARRGRLPLALIRSLVAFRPCGPVFRQRKVLAASVQRAGGGLLDAAGNCWGGGVAAQPVRKTTDFQNSNPLFRSFLKWSLVFMGGCKRPKLCRDLSDREGTGFLAVPAPKHPTNIFYFRGNIVDCLMGSRVQGFPLQPGQSNLAAILLLTTR